MSSQLRHMSDGNAVHCCLRGIGLTLKLRVLDDLNGVVAALQFST